MLVGGGGFCCCCGFAVVVCHFRLRFFVCFLFFSVAGVGGCTFNVLLG